LQAAKHGTSRRETPQVAHAKHANAAGGSRSLDGSNERGSGGVAVAAARLAVLVLVLALLLLLLLRTGKAEANHVARAVTVARGKAPGVD
jgi:hypothetical protein